MLLSEALSILRFWTGTLDDVTNKAVNDLFSNGNLINQLQLALNGYAKKTKAIEDIYSVPLNTATPSVAAPSLALRSESYRLALNVTTGRYWPMDIVGASDAIHAFPYSNIAGITNWIMPWGYQGKDYLYVFPLNGTTPNSTTISATITATDTTIPVVSTSGFLTNNGRFTLESEKISYLSKDATNFYYCRRGEEQTTAAAHTSSATVTENNLWLFYSRLHREISCYQNIIPTEELNLSLEVFEEHIETVLKYAAYNLLMKVDPNRAAQYKIDWERFLEETTAEIRKGRSRKINRQLRDAYLSEQGLPAWNTIY